MLVRTATHTQQFTAAAVRVCVAYVFVFCLLFFCAVDSAGAFDDTYAEINSSDGDTGLKADRRASVAWEGGVAAWLPDGADDRYDVVQGERKYEVPSSRASKDATYAATYDVASNSRVNPGAADRQYMQPRSGPVFDGLYENVNEDNAMLFDVAGSTADTNRPSHINPVYNVPSNATTATKRHKKRTHPQLDRSSGKLSVGDRDDDDDNDDDGSEQETSFHSNPTFRHADGREAEYAAISEEATHDLGDPNKSDIVA